MFMYSIGIDLGGTNIAVGICDKDLNLIDKISSPTLPERGNEAVVEDMARLALKLIERKNIKISDLKSVGIATPGSVNPKAGIVESAFNLGFKNFPIVKAFKKYFPTDEVFVANDANAAALGEALAGAAHGANSSVMITLGTGVGGGVILDGEIFDGGVNSLGTEFGHMVIVAGGRQCTCGRRGCFEAYSSATALTTSTKEKLAELKIKGIPSLLFEESKNGSKVNARVAFDAMRRGDKYGQALVEEYIYYLAVGITNIINIFQPEVLSIGGGVSAERDYLLKPLMELVDREQFTRDSNSKTKVVIATLGNDAGIIGAAGLHR